MNLNGVDITVFIPNLQYLCQDLKKFYDASLIDKVVYPIKEIFQHISQHCTEGRNVLQRLINNYYNPSPDPKKRKPVTKYIGGPKNLTVHWGNGFDMMVYVFGEFHQDIMDCASKFDRVKFLTQVDENFMSVDDYMLQLFNNTDKFLDYAIELPTLGRKNYMLYPDFIIEKQNFRLNQLFQKFKDCIQPFTRHKHDCQLGRVHFFDVRHQNTHHTDDISFLIDSFRKIKNDINKVADILNDKDFIRIFDNLKLCTHRKTKLIEYFSAHIFGNPYNVVEMDRLLNSTDPDQSIALDDVTMAIELRAFIRSEIKERINKYHTTIKYNIDIIVDYYTYYTKSTQQVPIQTPPNVITSFQAIIPCFVSIVSISPDLYVLARLFKSFDLSKTAFQGSILHDQPIKAYNVVIYAGDQHAQRYRRFLNYQDFKEVGKTGQSETGRDNDSCIDMRYIHQPFFSEQSKVPQIIPEKDKYIFNYAHTYEYESPLVPMDVN